MKEENINRRRTMSNRLANIFSKVAKNLWNGENSINGTNRAEQQPVKADVENFEAVIKSIHAREDEYIANMRTNGNLGEAQRINRARESRQQTSMDRADY